MDRPVALIPIVCLKCSTPIPAMPDEVAWVCERCGQCQALDDDIGLVPLQIHFMPGIPAQGKGKPFWVVDGQVSLDRETYSGDKAAEAFKFWGQRRRFFIPAFATKLEAGFDLANALLLRPPELQEGTPVAFEPVVVTQQDVRPLVEFLVMSVEAARSDQLKELSFNIQLTPPDLWVLP